MEFRGNVWHTPGAFLVFSLLVLFVAVLMTFNGNFWVPDHRFDGARGFLLSYLLYRVYKWFRH